MRVTLGFFSRLCQAKQKEQANKQGSKEIQSDNITIEEKNDSFEKSISFGVFGAGRTLNKRNVELLKLTPEIWQRILGNPSPSQLKWILEGSWEVLYSAELLAKRVAEKLVIGNPKFPGDKIPKLEEELGKWLFLKHTTPYDPIPPNIAKAAGIKPRVVEVTRVTPRTHSTKSLRDEGLADVPPKKIGFPTEPKPTDDPFELAHSRFEREWEKLQTRGSRSQQGKSVTRRHPKHATIIDRPISKRRKSNAEPPQILKAGTPYTVEDINTIHRMLSDGTPDDEIIKYAREHGLPELADNLAKLAKREAKEAASQAVQAKDLPNVPVVEDAVPLARKGTPNAPPIIITDSSQAASPSGRVKEAAEAVTVEPQNVETPIVQTPKTDVAAKVPAKTKRDHIRPKEIQKPEDKFIRFSLLNVQLQPGRLTQFVDSGIISKEGICKALDGTLDINQLENVFNGNAHLTFEPPVVVDKLTMFLWNEHKVIDPDLKNIKNELGKLLYDPDANVSESIENLISLLKIQKSSLNKPGSITPTERTTQSKNGQITDEFKRQLAEKLKGKGPIIEDQSMLKQRIKLYAEDGSEINLPDRPISIKPAAATSVEVKSAEAASSDVSASRPAVDLAGNQPAQVELIPKSGSDVLDITSGNLTEPIKPVDKTEIVQNDLGVNIPQTNIERSAVVEPDTVIIKPAVASVGDKFVVQTHPLVNESEPLVGKCCKQVNIYVLRGIISAPDLTKLFGLKSENQAVSILGNSEQLPFAPAVNAEIFADYLITKHKAELKPVEREQFITFVEDMIYTKAPFISGIDAKIQSQLDRYKPKPAEIPRVSGRKGRRGSRALQKTPQVLTFDNIMPSKPELVKLKEALVNAGLTVQDVCEQLSLKPFQLMRKFKDDSRIFFYGQEIFDLSKKTGQNLFVILDGEQKFKPEKLNFTEFPDIDLETAKNRIKDNLVQARINEGIATQTEASDKTGIAIQTFSNIEHGRQSISIPNLFKCLETYKNAKLEQLFAKPAEKPSVVIDTTSQGGAEAVEITKRETSSHLVPHLDINRPEGTNYPIITAHAAETKAKRVLTRPKTVMNFDNIIPVKIELIKLKEELIKAGVTVQDACEVLECSEGKLQNLFMETSSLKGKMQFRAHHIYLLSIKAKTDLFRIFDENNVLKSESLKLNDSKLIPSENAKTILADNLLYIRKNIAEMTMKEVSEKTGITVGTVNNIEAGAVGANIEDLKKFAEIYEMPLSRLFADNVNLSHLVPHIDIYPPNSALIKSEPVIITTPKQRAPKALTKTAEIQPFDDIIPVKTELKSLKEALIQGGVSLQDACEIIGTTAARLNHMFNEAKNYKFSAHQIYLLSIKTKTNLFKIFDEGNVLNSDLLDFGNAQLIPSKDARYLLSNNLRIARYQAGENGSRMSAKDAASKTGIDYHKIQNIEGGLIGATLDELKKFAEVYKVSLNELFEKSDGKAVKEVTKPVKDSIEHLEPKQQIISSTLEAGPSKNLIEPSASEIIISQNPSTPISVTQGTPAEAVTANLGYGRIKAGDGRTEEMIRTFERSKLSLDDAAKAINYGKDTFVSKLKGKTNFFAEELAILSGKTGTNLFAIFNGNGHNASSAFNYVALADMDVKTARSLLAGKLAQYIGTSRDDITRFANLHGYPSRFSVQFLIDGSSKVSIESFMRLCKELDKAPEEFFS